MTAWASELAGPTLERLESLHGFVATQRSRWQWLRWFEACGWTGSGVLAYFLVAVLLDDVVHLPSWGRVGAAVGLIAVLVALGRRLRERWRERHASEDEIALAIERRTPGGLQNRLINTLQIARDGRVGQQSFSEALVEENHRHLQSRPLEGAVALRPTVVWLAVAVTLAAILCAGWMWQPARFGTSAARILLPFASIDPVYRTTLFVEPGDVETTGDVEIRVRILGERLTEIAVLLDDRDRRSSSIVPVAGDVATYTIRNIERSLSYAVRGGDFTSPFYHIEVPTPARLTRVRATYRSPDYLQLPEKTVETSGDLEAVSGTQAALVLFFDHATDEATLVVRELPKVRGQAPQNSELAEHRVERAPASAPPILNSAVPDPGADPRAATSQDSEVRRIPLERRGPQEFAGSLAFDRVTEYTVETCRSGRIAHRGAWHDVRVIPDEPPQGELAGLPTSGEAAIDATLDLRVTASDDFGLAQAGLLVRRLSGDAAEDWSPVQVWSGDRATNFEHVAQWLPSAAGAAEGDRFELAAGTMDHHPDRAKHWTVGTPHVVLVAGDGTRLQILYEQILRTEAELTSIVTAAEQLHRQTDTWVRKLDADPTLDANDPAKVKDILAQAAAQSAEQTQLRLTAGRVAREMVSEAGNLRLSLGMLADTEMIRAVRVLDSVATRDDAAGRRTALAEARSTHQRTHASLQQILEQYSRFRQDWELAHMTPFLRMLADRQAALCEASRRHAEAASEESREVRGQAPQNSKLAGNSLNPNSSSARPILNSAVPDPSGGTTPFEDSGRATQSTTAARRQDKLAELCRLAETAFAGLAERVQEADSELAEAFSQTATSLGAGALTAPQTAAIEMLNRGDWSAASRFQERAAQRLDEIYAQLREAQTAAARRVLDALDERRESDLAAQAELEKLKAGYGDDLLDEPAGLKLEDIIHLAEVAQGKKQGQDEELKPNHYLFPDSAVPGLQREDTGKRQEFDILKLASTPGKTPSFPSQSDRQGNRVKPHIQEKFEDLVGDLLEEEDEMQANYETYNLNAAFNINEPGEIGKQAGDLNSTAAAAATGNQKPPTTNVGGASRVGRQGARAHGAAMGNESINRRGRDKVQEGQQRSPDQAGSVRETKSDDPQNDTSTGIGGRKVESDESKFSLNDAGEWTDDMAERMDTPQAKQSIVERQGGKLDSAVGEMLRDRTSKQEQLIERLKTIRKDLKNLYLPTEHLDPLIDQMQAHLHSLNERPSAEVFRLQQETLEQIRGALTVFQQAHSGFQASLPRDQAVRGRVLDDPARAAPPGYEEAVKTYYERLATP